MDFESIINLVIAILSGIATCIPLMIQLGKTIKTAVKEKNWNNLLGLVVDLMGTAEDMYDDGATRKEWVVSMVESSAKSINYDFDEDVVGKLIDDLAAMAKVVNVKN